MIHAKNRKTRTTLRVLFLLAFMLAGMLISASVLTAAPTEVKVEVTGMTMGKISYKVVVVADPPEEQCETIKDAVTDALDRVNDLMSTWKPDSDVSRFNDSDSTDWFPVDQQTAIVVRRALEISAASEGAFDITVGPAVNAWKFGPDESEFKPLTEEKTAALKKITGYKKLQARVAAAALQPALKKSIAELEIDLSAIAKGYAVDQVAVAIRELGFNRYLVEVGGEVIVSGERSGGGSWTIGLEDPENAFDGFPMAGLSKLKVKLSDAAIATSGDYRNFHVYKGQRYSHTIDPQTCRPVTHALSTASVIADDCMTADAWATAAMVLGQSRAHELAERSGMPMLTLATSDNGTKQKISGAYPIVAEKPTGTFASIVPTFLIALLVFMLAVVGMAIGAIVANKPVTGSCGGIAAVVGEDGDASCQVCSKPVTECALPESVR